MPGVAPVTKFKDRKTALRRIWAVLEELPLAKAKAQPAPRETKQGAIIALLKRQGGVTVTEIVDAIGWQPHSVRGLFAGTLRKKLGLAVASVKEKRGRVYRITE
jgi:hypothetical protein